MYLISTVTENMITFYLEVQFLILLLKLHKPCWAQFEFQNILMQLPTVKGKASSRTGYNTRNRLVAVQYVKYIQGT